MSQDGYWSKFGRARVSRRRALGGAMALAAGAVAWTACGGSDDAPPPDASAPKSGGTLRTGTTVPYSGLDPQTEAGTGLAIVARLYGYLLHVDNRDDSILYDQAGTIEQPDATTFVIRLRDDVRFHDVEPVNGRLVTANDAAQSIERFRKNALAPTRAFHTSVLDRVEPVDDRTLRVTTNRPYVYTLAYLGDISAGAIIPAEYIQSSTSLYTQAAGTGPFRLESAAPPDSARLVRHPGYYRSPIPYLDAMQWQVYATDDEKYRALAAGEVDVIPAEARAPVQSLADSIEDLEVTAEPSLSWLALGMRVDRPPLQDPRVRGAIDLALDRDAIIRDLAAGDGRILGPVNPQLADGYWSLFDDELRESFGGTLEIEDRRTGARAYLSAAGAEGAELRLQVANTPALLDLANIIRDHLSRIGLAVQIEPLDLLSWFTNFRGGRFETTLVSHIPYETADVPLRFFHSAGPDATESPFGFADPAIDALVERSWGESDRGQRRATIYEAQQRMVDARPMLQLFTGTGYSAAWKHVRNRRPGLPGSLAHYNYEQWLNT
jgi:peptide/nickel transport system substrate-binding protein